MNYFGSDNNAGAWPEVMLWLEKVNQGTYSSYGHDPYTAQCKALFQEKLGLGIEVAFVYTGTAANLIGLAPLLRAWEGVLCTDVSHLNTAEGMAPEVHLRTKLFSVRHSVGKLTPSAALAVLNLPADEHFPKPKVLSVTQPTEYGTLYTLDELKALKQLCMDYQLFFHIDGARIANAAAALDLPIRSFTLDIGCDVLSFGGSKAGLLASEAIVYANHSLAAFHKHYQKQAMQLGAKARYQAGQFLAFFDNDNYLRYANHANAMAKRLFDGIKDLPSVTITQPVQTNAVFAILPPDVIEKLQEHHYFYIWDNSTHEVRLMTSWTTLPHEVDAFITDLTNLVSRHQSHSIYANNNLI